MDGCQRRWSGGPRITDMFITIYLFAQYTIERKLEGKERKLLSTHLNGRISLLLLPLMPAGGRTMAPTTTNTYSPIPGISETDAYRVDYTCLAANAGARTRR